MKIKTIEGDFTVCRLRSVGDIDPTCDFYFLGKTEEEISLVCRTENVPAHTAAREDGWKAFRIEGVLDFSLVGILAEISGILAKNGIALFAVSTYNTDYILVKKDDYKKAMSALSAAGYSAA